MGDHSTTVHCTLQVIFRGGEGALQVFPPLLGVVTEARLNLAIYYLKQGMSHTVLPVSSSVTCHPMVGNIEEAYQLIRDLEPSSPQEYILKAVANAFIGQEQGSVCPLHSNTVPLTVSPPSARECEASSAVLPASWQFRE